MSKALVSLIILFSFAMMQCKTKVNQTEKLASDSEVIEVEAAAEAAAETSNDAEDVQEENNNQEEYAKVKFLVTYSEPYCGGAPPPAEMIKEMRTPKPYGDFSIYIRKGDKLDYKKEIYQELKTDEHGVINVKLPYGFYTAVSDKKKDSDTYKDYLSKYSTATKTTTAIDVACLEKFMNTPDSKFEIKGDETIEIHYNKQCFYNEIPCLDYTGPLPH